MEQPKRRLSAIWFADIVGYSELSTHDEPAAMRLVDLLQGLCRDIVTTYEGRVVKFIGDACLAEFASTDSAVRSAVSLQERFVAEGAASGQSAQLRIGVHLGEVTATPDGDLYGDGINTASRLHHKAEPGRVVISEDVWRVLRQRPEFRFAPLGAVELRGITTRVEVYDVLFGSRAALAPASIPAPVGRAPESTSGGGRMAVVAGVVAVIAVAATVLALKFWDTSERVTPQTPAPSAETAAPAAPQVNPAGAPSTEPASRTSPQKPTSQKPVEQKTTEQKPVEQKAVPAPSPAVPPTTAKPNRPRGEGAFQPPAVRALVERLAAAITSERPREAVAALGPGAILLSGRGVQQLKDTFGTNLAIRVGRIEPLKILDDKVMVRVVLFAKGSARPEMPLVYVATIDRDTQGQLRFAELRREFVDGRRGRQPLR